MDTLGTLIADFECLTTDGVLAGDRLDYDAVLGEPGPGVSILDCACATGAQAIALRRHGYAVAGSDPRAAMVARARARVSAEQAFVPIRHCEWATLERCFDERFDAVMCGGNSIVHAGRPDEILRGLHGMRRVTKRDGRLVLASRNWEALRAWQPRVFLPGQWHETSGARTLAMYVWTISKQWSQPHVLDVVILHDSGERVMHRHHTIRYQPFRVKDLVKLVRAAGYAQVEIDYTHSLEWYTVVARAV